VGDLQEIGDVVANALVDLLPEIEVMRIKGVVEIEHPGFDIGKAASADSGITLIHLVLLVAVRPGDGM
jgi:hypothetical protein